MSRYAANTVKTCRREFHQGVTPILRNIIRLKVTILLPFGTIQTLMYRITHHDLHLVKIALLGVVPGFDIQNCQG